MFGYFRLCAIFMKIRHSMHPLAVSTLLFTLKHERMTRQSFFTGVLLLIILVIMGTTPRLYAQTEPAMSDSSDSLYQQEWQIIDSLMEEGLYRSGLTELENLRQAAADQGLTDHYIRAMLYLSIYVGELEEDRMLAVIRRLKAEISTQSGVEKAMLQSVLAQVLGEYLQSQYWRIADRTYTADRDTAAVDEWSIERLEKTIRTYYIASLSPEEALRQVSLTDLPQAIDQGEEVDDLWPTLYDFLVHRAISYFSNTLSYVQEPVTAFVLNEAQAFAPPGEFIDHRFTGGDTTSNVYRALTLFQNLLTIRLDEPDNIPAIIDLDLQRLSFAYEHATLPEKDTLYRQALTRLANTYPNHPASANARYALARQYQQSGNKYQAPSRLSNRWHLQKAVSICQECLEDFPEAYGARRCESLINSIKRPALNVRLEEVILPDHALLIKASYRNLEGFHARILRFTEKQYQDYQRAYGDARLAILADMEVVRTEFLDLPAQRDYQTHGTEVMTAGLPRGQYLFQFSKTDQFSTDGSWDTGMMPFQVSAISFFSRQTEARNMEFLVTHREQGAPLPDAEVTMFSVSNREQWQKLGQGRTDKRGFTQSWPQGQSYVLRIEYKEDVLYSTDRFYNQMSPTKPEPVRRIKFFLDRSLYRPGQTVFFKGIAFRQKEKEQPTIMADEQVTVALIDANYQEVSEQTFTTNEFGTFHGTFKAPSSALNGRMQLRVKEWNSSAYFQVEEYKRPTFTVELDSLEGARQLGDTIAVTGSARTFSGSAVAGQEVSYVVNRRARFPLSPWWRYGSSPSFGVSQQVAVGTTRTNAEGTFGLEFTAVPDRNIPEDQNPYFVYTVSVTVTDLTGETHTREKSLTLSYDPFRLQIDYPQELERSEDVVPALSAVNAEGKKLNIPIDVALFRLEAPGQIFRNRYWDRPDVWAMSEELYQQNFPGYAYAGADDPTQWSRSSVLRTYQFTGGQSVVEWTTDILTAGHYVMVVRAVDESGRSVEREHFFQVTDREARALAAGKLLWQSVTPGSAEPGEEIAVTLGSNLKQRTLVEIERSGTIVSSEWLAAWEWPTLAYTLEEEDRGNIFVLLTFVRDNRTYFHRQQVTVPWTNKQLKISFETFRDKLRPGQDEEWRIRIAGAERDRLAAEMVATMYDASLDDLLPHRWQWALYPTYGYPTLEWESRQFSALYDRLIYPIESGRPVGRRAYPSFNWPRQNYFKSAGAPVSYSARSLDMTQQRANSEEAMAPPGAPPPPPPSPGEVPEEEGISKDSAGVGMGADDTGQGPEPLTIRRNLDETVFFMPELYTDENGDIIVSFTMNEALTRWAFLGMAHTKDLAYGLIRREVVTQKELMVQPNAPRFVREGDELFFTARVANLTDKPLTGTGELQLFDAVTMEPVDVAFALKETEQSFSLDAKGSTLLSWKLSVPSGEVTALTHRVFVRAGNYSDGEESTLPVLSNRMLVTETLPFSVRPGENKTVTMASFGESRKSKTLVPHQLTIDFTANPAWLAVKSMPYLMEFPHECSEQVFSRYYANALATHLIESFPRVQRIFARWREAEGLESNLVRNEELRAVLLEETPWVLDAQSEEEQRRNIAMLFDLERMSSELQSAMAKLEENQLPDGSFPWFAGGPGNRYITQHIVAGMGHLRALGVLSAEQMANTEWLTQAVGYLDKEVIEQYQRLKERAEADKADLRADHLSNMVVHYLYTRSFFPEKPWPTQLREAMEFYHEQADSFWTRKSVFAQGMLGLEAWRTERANLAERIRRSLKERAFSSDELGIYWRYQRGYHWNELPLETHALLMEFFSLWPEDASLVDEMKVWLLKNKQTNHWKTTKATAAAIYVLLRTNDGGWILEEQPQADIRFPEVRKKHFQDKLKAARESAEPGTGYWKASWSGEEIREDMGTLRIKNKGDVLSWGGLYWQYFEELDKIKTFRETPLTMRKELFVRTYNQEGAVLIPLVENAILQPGAELVVRIRIDVDRPMEYVHLKDMRAAGLEPINILSRYRFQGGLGYYQSTGDVATHFFLEYLPRGVHVFEYPLRVTHRGTFSNGISSLQCMYAPEFSTHSAGRSLSIGN